MPIPGTVQEVIAARLDRLGAQAKRVVQVAAVLGRQFHREQLAGCSQARAIDVAAELDELEQRGIIHRKNAALRRRVPLRREPHAGGRLRGAAAEAAPRSCTSASACCSRPTRGEAAPSARRSSRITSRAATTARKAIEALLARRASAERLPSYRAAADFYRQAWELGYASLAEGAEVDDDFRRLVVSAALDLCRMAVQYVAAPSSFDIENTAKVGLELAEALGDVEAAAGFRAITA